MGKWVHCVKLYVGFLFRYSARIYFGLFIMKRHLPPFTAVPAFEAAAKHENFKKAAEETSLSASAVSRQLRSLEDYLKVSLFRRKNGNVKLTDKGNVYYHQIGEIINDLEKATIEVSVQRNVDRLVINPDYSLSSCWLEHSIQSFREHYPEVEIDSNSSVPLLLTINVCTITIDHLIYCQYNKCIWKSCTAQGRIRVTS